MINLYYENVIDIYSAAYTNTLLHKKVYSTNYINKN